MSIMEKQYIAPSLTIVSVCVERGYVDSGGIIASDDSNSLNFTSLVATGCDGENEERETRSGWGSSEASNTFWTADD